MAYHFSCNTKTLVALLAGCSSIGLLLFVAGMLVGASMPFTDTPHVAQKPTERTVATEVTSAEKPVTHPQTRGRTLTAIAMAQPSSESEGALPSSQQEQTAQAGAPKEDVQNRSMSAAESQSVAAATAEQSVVPRKPLPRQSLPSPENRASPEQVFTVQVGAFLEQQNAARLAEDLQSKGYTPSIFRVWDARQRLWYTMRMGSYAERADALQAATVFREKENMPAIVRPRGVL